MQNRRSRSQQPVPTRDDPSVVLSKAKTAMTITAVVLVGLYLMSRTHSAPTTQSQAKVAAAEIKAEVKRTEQAPFPSLSTEGFTPVQQKMLEVMKQEYAKEPTSYDQTVLEYTEGAKESWCADFVSVVRFAAGKPFINHETGYWRIPGVQSLRDYYAASDAYHFVGSYTPKFGDVAFYFGETPDGQNREHVAFVLSVNGDTITTLGGNETDKGILQIRSDKLVEGTKGLAGLGESSL